MFQYKPNHTTTRVISCQSQRDLRCMRITSSSHTVWEVTYSAVSMMGIRASLWWEKALMIVWWPRLENEIQELVTKGPERMHTRPTQRKEPLMTISLPPRPWHKIGADICKAGLLVWRWLYYSCALEMALTWWVGPPVHGWTLCLLGGVVQMT